MRKILGYGAFILLFAAAYWLSDKNEDEVEAAIAERLPAPKMMEPKTFYGFDLGEYSVVSDTIKTNQYLADILLPYEVSYPEIDALVRNTKDVFNVHSIRAHRPYHLLLNNDSTQSACCLIYEQDPINYVMLHLGDSLYATLGEKAVKTEESSASGVITSSLYQTLVDNDLSQTLALEMADIFAWTVDFYRIQKGDRFKVIYDNRYIEDEFIGIGDIKACIFEHGGQEYRAYAFEQEGKVDFFDEDGDGMKKAFLKSPLKFGRMTSGYSGRRFHPVQKRYKAHKGTDYAAPRGTPILATGDGTVSKVGYTRGNGNYVKIRHNSTYSTQYLHMTKAAVKNGQGVRQGDVIGYVGSTGLATGPHVCYRFWKNGAQVDSRREKFPSTDPVLSDNKAAFEEVMKHWDSLLQEVGFEEEAGPLASNY